MYLDMIQATFKAWLHMSRNIFRDKINIFEDKEISMELNIRFCAIKEDHWIKIESTAKSNSWSLYKGYLAS